MKALIWVSFKLRPVYRTCHGWSLLNFSFILSQYLCFHVCSCGCTCAYLYMCICVFVYTEVWQLCCSFLGTVHFDYISLSTLWPPFIILFVNLHFNPQNQISIAHKHIRVGVGKLLEATLLIKSDSFLGDITSSSARCGALEAPAQSTLKILAGLILCRPKWVNFTKLSSH